MRIILVALSIMSCPAFAFFEAPVKGNCEISMPRQIDKARIYCTSGYAIKYKGYIDRSIGCLDTLVGAIEKMNSMKSCDRPARQGECQIAYPLRVDKKHRYCRQEFGVMYDGYILEEYSCNGIEVAMAAMDEVCPQN